MDKRNLTDVLEISELIVDGSGSSFLDKGMLMHMAKANAYECKEDAILDGKVPRRVRLVFHVYVEELVE